MVLDDTRRWRISVYADNHVAAFYDVRLEQYAVLDVQCMLHLTHPGKTPLYFSYSSYVWLLGPQSIMQ